ncbi:nucleoside hydrolase [Oenococcus sp.]|uniref:nucleoside hydrolase n=1 Tax=Oenococcus sp. TaxID=1979414 RepID=UPI0039EC8776
MAEKHIILDCDPGVDDAFAIVAAILDPTIKLDLISTVAGNVSVDRTTKNALYLVQDMKAKVPVASGAARPLLRELESYEPWFGESGLGDYANGDLVISETDENAVAKIYETLIENSHPMTIVGTGAYTNLALLLVEHPDIKPKIKEFILMGGTLSQGNMSSVAEFNIYCDPEAADLIYRSGIPIITAGIDVSQKALIQFQTNDQLAGFGFVGDKLATLLKDYAERQENGFIVYDLNTIAYLLHPEFYKSRNYYIAIQKDGPARGASVADLSDRKDTNVKVLTDVDSQQLNGWLIKEMSALSKINA